MKFFQVPYDAIKRWKCRWLCDFLGYVQKEILAPALMAVGEAGLAYIKIKIREQANLDISSTEKFENVFNACRDRVNFKDIRNNVLDAIIQNAYTEMKDKGIV
jgi:hypothetical protein